MREVTDIKRIKKVYNISISELKKGDWLKEIPDSDMVEINFKKNYLSYTDCQIKSVKEKREGER